MLRHAMHVLEQDPNWSAFLRHSQSHGAWTKVVPEIREQAPSRFANKTCKTQVLDFWNPCLESSDNDDDDEDHENGGCSYAFFP